MDEHERSTPEPGEARGKSRTAILILIAVLSIICFVAETQAAPVITYSFSDVDFPGADFSQAFGLNDRGQVVGTAGLLPPPGQRLDFGFVFSSGQFTQFAVPSASIFTQLMGINNSGTIVGTSALPAQGLVLQDGVFNPIIVPGAIGTSTPGINDRGDIVGLYEFDRISPSRTHGFILRNGQFTPIPDPPGLENPNYRGINNRGDIVGFGSDTSAAHAPHGFMFDGSTFTPIDVPGANQTMALGINDRGQIVGEAVLDNGTRVSGFLLDRQAFTLIDVPGAFATAINGINNRGQIVGTYNDDRCSDPGCSHAHGFFATPVPETPSLLLLICGVIGLIALLGRAAHAVEPLGPKSRRGGRAHALHRPGSVERVR